jgi:hypothetical protein
LRLRHFKSVFSSGKADLADSLILFCGSLITFQ